MATGESRYGRGDVLAVPAMTKEGRRISVEFTIVSLRNEVRKVVGAAAILPRCYKALGRGSRAEAPACPIHETANGWGRLLTRGQNLLLEEIASNPTRRPRG